MKRKHLSGWGIFLYAYLSIIPIVNIVEAVGYFLFMDLPNKPQPSITLEESLHILKDDIKPKYDSGYSIRESTIQEDAYSNGEHIIRGGELAYQDYDAYTILDFEREINLLIDWIKHPNKVTSYIASGTYGAGDLSLSVKGTLDSSSLTEFSFAYEHYRLRHWSSIVNDELIRYDFQFA